MAGKKVNIMLNRRKMFCWKPECGHKTFTEIFEFIEAKSRKTKRLQDEIMRVSLTQSSVSASKYLRRSVANVGKSTICNMLKKRETDTWVE
jgi:ribosome biogenesis GTPase A